MTEIDTVWQLSGDVIRRLDAHRNSIRITLEHTPRWKFRKRRKLSKLWLENAEYRQRILKASAEDMKEAVHRSIQDKSLEGYTIEELVAELDRRKNAI